MIKVTYTDGEVEHFDSIEDAEYGVKETVTGCNFAVTVENVEDDKGEMLFVTWNCKIGPLVVPETHS